MDRRKDSAQVQRLDVVELGRRRRWTEEAKRRIVEESFVGRRQASATARRYGISTVSADRILPRSAV
jgi:transposase